MEREQGKGRQTETENEIKTAGMGKAGDRVESPGLQSLQPGLPRVWTPHLLFFGFHSNGGAAPNLHIHLHPFYLHNSTGPCIFMRLNEGDSQSLLKTWLWRPLLAVCSHGSRPNLAGPDPSLPDPANNIPPAPQTPPLYFLPPDLSSGDAPLLSRDALPSASVLPTVHMHALAYTLTCAHMNSGGGGMAASDQCSPWLPGGGGPSVTLPSGVKEEGA